MTDGREPGPQGREGDRGRLAGSGLAAGSSGGGAGATAAGRPAGRAAGTDPRTWGADPLGDGRWRFGLWSPGARAVAVEVDGARHAMARDPEGIWAATLPARDGARYGFVVDGAFVPDPAARAAWGTDPAGPSRLVDPSLYRWSVPWAGRPWEEAAIYELHVGAFTPEGTFAAAAGRMAGLADLGVTAVELMPVPHFPGLRGWGYDGILLGAPHPVYGPPDDLRRLVEAAHAAGLMVLLDVVLNHFSPEGSAMHRIAPGFFEPERHTPWGAAIDYTRPAVRAFAFDLCLTWLREYRLDGLRLDAVHQVQDPSEPHVLVELAARIRSQDWGRPIHLIVEDERNVPDYREPRAEPPFRGRAPFDAQWNDDFHHAMHVLLTGETHAYLGSFAADPVGDVAKALREGAVETGQPRGDGTGEPRGRPTAHLPPTAFVNHLQNHDQVGNHPHGRRLLATVEDPRPVETAYALLLCGPYIPMIFMGEEVGELAPFHFFSDVSPELGRLIWEGRKREFADGADEPGPPFPDPQDPRTLHGSRPFTAPDGPLARQWRGLTRRLLAFRAGRVVPLLKSGRAGPGEVRRDGSALEARWRFAAGDLLLRVNLGAPPAAPWAWEGGWADPPVRIGEPDRDDFAIAVTTLSHRSPA